MNEQGHKSNLWTNEQTGEIACVSHFGTYAKCALEAKPKARSLKTPLGTWTPWTEDDDNHVDRGVRSQGEVPDLRLDQLKYSSKRGVYGRKSVR
jgi:hypothetical protein